MKLELDQQIYNQLFDYIDKNCIFRANPEVKYFKYLPKGNILPNGISMKPMTWCFYLRRLTHNAVALRDVAFTIAQDIIKKCHNGDESSEIQLCGLETASIPLIAAVQMAFIQGGINVNAFTVRKDRKAYGLCHLIDGIPNNNKIIVIDDMINSGSSVSKVIDTCFYELDLTPANNVYCIIGAKDEHRWSSTTGVPNLNVNYLFHKDDFNKSYDPDKYWLPKDCDKTYNKRTL